jgi:hypothetical protein
MMRRRAVLGFLAGAACVVAGTGPLAVSGAWAGAVRAAGVWGKAIEVPGLGVLNQGGNASVASVSCTATGNCAAGGFYRDRSRHLQGFVATERRGRWGLAAEVPGLGALNQGGAVGAWSVSCRSAGSCAVAGDYTDSAADRQGFVGSEKNGAWGTAIEVPGLGALNQGVELARADTVSCVSAGNCTAGGYYTDGSSQEQGFVAVEKNGVWGPAAGVPGLEALNDGTDQPEALVSSVSCTAPGDCLAGGAYGGPYSWAFTATEKNGVWGKATIVAGLSAIVTGRWSEVGPVSCVSPGNCAIAGDYENVVPGNIFSHGFVASQQNGRLGNAINMPALKVLTKTVNTDVLSVSCGSPGHCTTGGSYQDNHGHLQGFVTQSGTP